MEQKAPIGKIRVLDEKGQLQLVTKFATNGKKIKMVLVDKKGTMVLLVTKIVFNNKKAPNNKIYSDG